MTRYGVKTRMLNTAVSSTMTGAKRMRMGANNAWKSSTVVDTKKDTMRNCTVRIERMNGIGEGMYVRYLKMLTLGADGA